MLLRWLPSTVMVVMMVVVVVGVVGVLVVVVMAGRGGALYRPEEDEGQYYVGRDPDIRKG